MPRKRNTPKRLVNSYETACAALEIEPLIADDQPLPRSGAFTDTDSAQAMKRLAGRAIARPPRLVAYPLPGLPGRPQVVAEFSGELVLERRNGRLTQAKPDTRLPYADRANLQWIYWGELLASPTGQLALGPLAIGPWPGADSPLEETARPFHGVSTDILRALRPAELIRQITAALRDLDERHRFVSERYGWPEPTKQRQLLDQTVTRMCGSGRRAGRRYPDSHYRAIAIHYLALLDEGGTHKIIIRLAERLNIRRATARDWVHRARTLEYLTPSRQGRAGANPGRRLTDET